MVDTLSRPPVYHPISLLQTNGEYEYILHSHLYGYVQTSAIFLPKFETTYRDQSREELWASVPVSKVRLKYHFPIGYSLSVYIINPACPYHSQTSRSRAKQIGTIRYFIGNFLSVLQFTTPGALTGPK